MELIDDKSKLMKFWSVRASIFAALFALLDLLSQMTDVLPFVKGIVPDRTFMVMSLVCALAAPVLRAIKQASLHDESGQP
jgi:hypothetical protein